MSRGLILFIVVAGIAIFCMIGIAMKQSADNARKRSDEIMEQFKTIDNSLQQTTVEAPDSLIQKDFDSILNVINNHH